MSKLDSCNVSFIHQVPNTDYGRLLEEVSNALQIIHDFRNRVSSLGDLMSYQRLMDRVNDRIVDAQKAKIYKYNKISKLLEFGLRVKGEGWYGEMYRLFKYGLSKGDTREGSRILGNLELRLMKELGSNAQ